MRVLRGRSAVRKLLSIETQISFLTGDICKPVTDVMLPRRDIAWTWRPDEWARLIGSSLNLPPPDQSFDRHWQLGHRTDDGLGSGRGKTSGQLIAGVAGACESNGGHGGSPGCLDAQNGILYDYATRWIGLEAARS